MKDAVIAAYGRSAVAKIRKGSLAKSQPEDTLKQVLKGTLARVPAFDLAELDDVIIGCAFPEAEQGFNIGRITALASGLPISVPGQTVNRFCASGLQSIANAAYSIMCGQNRAVMAGGIEFMSVVPMGGNNLVTDPALIDSYPQAYTLMGLTAENVAKRYGISREEQDKFSYESHIRAAKARREGKFAQQIIPVEVRTMQVGPDNKPVLKTRVFDTDEGIRENISMEGLARLRPVFMKNGTVTAGNSSQMNDAAATVLVTSDDFAREHGMKPIARFVSFAAAGVEPDYMGTGPIRAIPKALKYAGLTIQDIGLFELNEAFASQAIACIRTLDLDPSIVNVEGGAIALGHPLGCTGSFLTSKLLCEMQLRHVHYGVVSMCIGGGMGAAAVYELL